MAALVATAGACRVRHAPAGPPQLALKCGLLLAVGLAGALGCSPRFEAPAAPLHATDLNGVRLPEVCIDPAISGLGPYHVYAIGDWGGLMINGLPTPTPADKRGAQFPGSTRDFVTGVDDNAQMRVAAQMRARAATMPPDYILNVGDNFYWGGVTAHCGLPPFQHAETGQFPLIFEAVYTGPGIDGKQWLGVLGNHDYGGFMFVSGWDQAIGYTWGGVGSTNRWMTPAQFWAVKVNYPGFSVDYYFVDSNRHDALPPETWPDQNLCSGLHNPNGSTCGPEGPESLEDCPGWFERLWAAQLKWLDTELPKSTADWQIVVTHFPPEFAADDWKYISAKHGVDLYISGHRHKQEVHPPGADNVLGATPYIVTGGGGGITSELMPDAAGDDDAYGFMDIVLTKGQINITSISHSGKLRTSILIGPIGPTATGEVRYT